MSLKDKEYESYRRVAPGRLVTGRRGQVEHEEYAMAVVGADGAAVGATSEELMGNLLYEIRALRQGMILAGTCVDIEEVEA